MGEVMPLAAFGLHINRNQYPIFRDEPGLFTVQRWAWQYDDAGEPISAFISPIGTVVGYRAAVALLPFGTVKRGRQADDHRKLKEVWYFDDGTGDAPCK